MSLSMHSASVPVFARMLGNLSTWLDKAEAHAAEKKFEPAVYLSARLAPDMLQLHPADPDRLRHRQVLRRAPVRERGAEVRRRRDDARRPARPDRPHDRLRSARSRPAQIDGSDGRDIALPRRDGTITLSGEAYLKNFVLPNFFFHVTTAYALLRHNGVPLGKMDYLGSLREGPAA